MTKVILTFFIMEYFWMIKSLLFVENTLPTVHSPYTEVISKKRLIEVDKNFLSKFKILRKVYILKEIVYFPSKKRNKKWEEE